MSLTLSVFTGHPQWVPWAQAQEVPRARGRGVISPFTTSHQNTMA